MLPNLIFVSSAPVCIIITIHIIIFQNLSLKIGCPVMLQKNLSDTLVNGLPGVVIKLTQTTATVKFENYTPGSVTFSKELFTV
jgi:hypothetical protein